MVRRFIAGALLAAFFAFSPQQLVQARPRAPAGNVQLAQSQTEAAAQAYAREIKSSGLTRTAAYITKGMHWYGRTKHGADVCREEADTAGDRDTRNRQ